MRKVILFMHMSLDGYVAGPNGEMDWISVDDEIFRAAIELQPAADTALLGGTLYQEMAGYWPTVPANQRQSRYTGQRQILVWQPHGHAEAEAGQQPGVQQRHGGAGV